MKRSFSIFFLAFMLLCGSIQAQTRRHRRRIRTFEATAYAQHNVTASGTESRRGVVAADTRVLPLGTRIQVRNAGQYSGTYTVADTGPAIQGRHIDIYMPSAIQARRFGKKVVQVRVLRWGAGRAG